MPTKLKDVSQNDFSGGINAVSSPYLVTDKQVQRTNNMVLDEHGSMRTRDGYAIVGTSPDTTDPIVLRDVLNTTDGNTYPFATQWDGTNQIYYRTYVNPWTQIGTVVSPYTTPASVTAGNVQIFATGYQTPQVWAGGAAGLVPI